MTVRAPHGPAQWAEHLTSAGDMTPKGVAQTGPSNAFRVCRSEAEADQQKQARETQMDRAPAGDHGYLRRLSDAEQSVSQCCHQGVRSASAEKRAERDMQELVSHLHEKGHPAANPNRDFAKQPVGEDEKWAWAGRPGRPMPDAERKVQDQQGRLDHGHHRSEAGQQERDDFIKRPPWPEECPKVNTHDEMRQGPMVTTPKPEPGLAEGMGDRIRAKRQGLALDR